MAARIIAAGAKERPTIAEQQCSGQVERIKRLAEERQIGLIEAKRIVLKDDLIAAIKLANTIEDFKDILLRVVG